MNRKRFKTRMWTALAGFLMLSILFIPIDGVPVIGPLLVRAASSCSGDFHGDGDVDGSDLAVFADHFDADGGDALVLDDFADAFGKIDCLIEPVQVHFEAVRARAGEGTSLPVSIVLSRPYSGTIFVERYGTAGDADHGLTCASTQCSASLTGITEAALTVPLTDDMEIEELEWLGLRIVPGPGYTVAAPLEHLIAIEDNDAVWTGLFSAGGEELAFSIEILRSGATLAARLLGEGGGIIPAGAALMDPLDLAFTPALNLDLKTFSATLPAVPLASTDTLLGMGTEGALWLELDASQATGSVDADRVEASSDMGSATRMRIHYASQPHLDSDVPGSFLLQRQPAKPSSAEVPLEDTY